MSEAVLPNSASCKFRGTPKHADVRSILGGMSRSGCRFRGTPKHADVRSFSLFLIPSGHSFEARQSTQMSEVACSLMVETYSFEARQSTQMSEAAEEIAEVVCFEARQSTQMSEASSFMSGICTVSRHAKARRCQKRASRSPCQESIFWHNSSTHSQFSLISDHS